MKVISVLKNNLQYFEDNIVKFFSERYKIPIQNIHYHPLTFDLQYDVLNPINSQSLFYTPYGVLSSSNTGDGVSINPIVRDISRIIPSDRYDVYNVLFKKMYVLKIPDFSGNSYSFVSDTVNFHNSTDNIVFSFLCYTSQNTNIESIEQLITDNSGNPISTQVISKKYTDKSKGCYDLVGVTSRTNGRNNGRLVIRINKKPGTGNKIQGRVIISEPVLFQYSLSSLIPPQFNNLYQYSVPMFSLSDSLPINGYGTLLFVFTPLSPRIPTSSSSNLFNFELFSFGQDSPQSLTEFGSVYTQQQSVRSFLTLEGTDYSFTGDFETTSKTANVRLTVQSITSPGDTPTIQSSQTVSTKLNEFYYHPHFQILKLMGNSLEIIVYLNFNKKLSVTVPFNGFNLKTYRQTSIFGSNVDFILGATIQNKTGPRVYFVPVKNSSQMLFRDLIFINGYVLSDFYPDLVTNKNSVFRPVFYKISEE